MSNDENVKHQPISTSSNTGDGNVVSAPADHAENSCLLEQTMQYHEERTHAYGVIRCELWLSRIHGIPIADRESTSVLPDTVYCWNLPQTVGLRNTLTTSGIPNDAFRSKNSKKSNGIHYTIKQENSSTMLGEQLANRLWSHHKEDRSDPNMMLWRRFGTLSDNTEDLPIRQHQRSPSSNNDSTAIDWIASIPFEVPAVAVAIAATDVTSGGDNASTSTSATSANFRGMVCWLFETETTENHDHDHDHHYSNDGDISLCHPPLIAENFLRCATNHIAATYALESFRHLPLPRRRSSASNLVDTAATNSSRRRRIPPELRYNDDLDSNGEGKGTMSSLEINGIGEEGDDDDDHDDGDESGRDGKSKILAAIRTYFRKYKGGGRKGPQPLCWRQTLFTFVGSFVTIFLIHGFNVFMTSTRETIQSVTDTSTMTTPTNIEMLKAWWDTKDDPPFSALEMGPFGATCVLIFAMTTVAPSQPRSVLVGTTIGMVVGKLVGYLEAWFGLGIRMALATALTASIMAQTCTIYPPAGSLAIIFSSQLLGWDKFLLQVVGTVLTLTLGVIINNIHPQRTYPTFWVGIEGCCGNNGDYNKRASGSESESGGCKSRF